MLASARFRVERMRESRGWRFLAGHRHRGSSRAPGMPFRDAHEIVGRVVAYCVAQGKDFPDLSADEWRCSRRFWRVAPSADAGRRVAAREMLGGTGSGHVARAAVRALRKS